MGIWKKKKTLQWIGGHNLKLRLCLVTAETLGIDIWEKGCLHQKKMVQQVDCQQCRKHIQLVVINSSQQKQ